MDVADWTHPRSPAYSQSCTGSVKAPMRPLPGPWAQADRKVSVAEAEPVWVLVPHAGDSRQATCLTGSQFACLSSRMRTEAD